MRDERRSGCWVGAGGRGGYAVGEVSEAAALCPRL